MVNILGREWLEFGARVSPGRDYGGVWPVVIHWVVLGGHLCLRGACRVRDWIWGLAYALALELSSWFLGFYLELKIGCLFWGWEDTVCVSARYVSYSNLIPPTTGPYTARCKLETPWALLGVSLPASEATGSHLWALIFNLPIQLTPNCRNWPPYPQEPLRKQQYNPTWNLCPLNLSAPSFHSLFRDPKVPEKDPRCLYSPGKHRGIFSPASLFFQRPWAVQVNVPVGIGAVISKRGHK